ncbi:hypothetical protein MTX26_35340 (plasmid) [Bradyrhizobium sp. ISRA443]|uniref:DUF7007 domain-containing protein n=1 Tax=unclassified Bradyrhizobium TaxID=2631580 RepID=UPI00247ADE40|nr:MULTISPECIES: hypothetical protein [unclassified Bradyrhizobium]WGR90714.1 hypothetical protein MTX20_01210 [Bradyrhizobium sp. ISRA435]WGS03160.1 hypothetical protein MTX23_35280 [Bradyrhizobium sp. ISRA436]WGS10046.1 hypothetical protein MTX18_35340 [Bradyrhizobium sp. ISRA437]WGS16931.1 hypothetical protein MTX26_35340 [Bradyrhizobium sp. ISRA443]
MNPSSPACIDNDAPGLPGVSFGRSADGLLVALVGDSAFAMAPARDGRHYLATAWRISRPMDEWRRGDFYGHSGVLADEAAFRARVLESAEHQRECKMFGRVEAHSHVHTPWGASQGATVYAKGVTSHSTAGHGGFKLSAERNGKVHPILRAKDGWYEEDAEWAIVAITFPYLFTAFERRCAEHTIKNSWPDAWETIFGAVLAPGESYEKDRRSFELTHANDWIVISAITSSHGNGFVECVATPGGRRGAGTEERRFLVPSAEYEVGRFGFVIDPNRHHVYAGPSDFVGWQTGRVT